MIADRRAGRRPHGRGGRHRQRPPDPDRARDRDRQHLQARHALLRAARRDLPRRERLRAADRHGLLRDRARRGSRPRRSSSTPTSAGSPGRGRSRRGTSSSSRSARRARPSAPPPTTLYDELEASGLKVLYDDRDAGGGEKFADAELIGMPAAPDGRQALAGVRARPRPRRGAAQRDIEAGVPAHGRRGGRAGAVGRTPLTFRRLSGLDRSGAPPPETQAGAPLRPWTIPNAIGFVRAALIPSRSWSLALSSDDGTDALPACCSRSSPGATTPTASRRA